MWSGGVLTTLAWLTALGAAQRQHLPPTQGLILNRADPAAVTATYTALPPLPPTATATPLPTLSPTSTAVPTPTFTPTSTLPARAGVTGVQGHWPRYNLSCEAAAAVDWAAFFGIRLDEAAFQAALPRSDNPNRGFVGDPNGPWGLIPPQDYGVHAPPVAALLRRYGLPAHAAHGLTWRDLQAEIAAGRPVIVWVIGDLWAGSAQRYTARDGETVLVAPYEHTVLLVGYTPTTVTVLNRGIRQTVPKTVFLRSWAVLDNMAVLWRP